MVVWQYFPRSDECPPLLRAVEGVFVTIYEQIASETHEGQVSNHALRLLRPGLVALGFEVESGTSTLGKVHVPVLFGRNGKVDKSFSADAWHRSDGVVLEVEAGRAVTNYQFLKDLFQACMMHDVHHLIIAVRNVYRKNDDWKTVATFFDTMYASRRISLPLDGVMVIGY